MLRRHAAGDSEAFGVVVARHRQRLWAVALRTLGDPEDAADALQDALVSALRASARGSFRGESAVTTWLHRIVVNACLDSVRRQRARPTVPLPEESGAGDGPGEQPASRRAAAVSDDPTPALDTALVVQQALRTLPREQAAALVLVDLHGWSVADAAVLLGVAPGTVKSRCARGRARLLPLLAAQRPAPGRAADEAERNQSGPGRVRQQGGREGSSGDPAPPATPSSPSGRSAP